MTPVAKTSSCLLSAARVYHEMKWFVSLNGIYTVLRGRKWHIRRVRDESSIRKCFQNMKHIG